MIQCPWCHGWRQRNLKMRIQFCPECSDAWDPVECNDEKSGDAIRRPAGPEEATNDSASGN